MHRSHRLTPVAAALLAALIVTAGASAEENRYGSWQPPDGAGGGDAEALLSELRALVDDAERARAADPRFLRDLRALADRFDGPALSPVLRDDFSDGDYSRGTTWTVTAGSFKAEPAYGLVSDRRAAQQAAPASTPQDGSGKDLAAALISGLLNQYAQPAQRPAAPSSPTGPSRIETRARVENAFEVELTVAADERSERLEFALFQGREGGPTYLLVYSPNATTPLELQRRTSRGSAVIGSYRQALAPGQQTRRIQWRRDRGGNMSVSVDGRELLRAADKGLRDPFDGFAISNHGGLFAVREVALSSIR